jgi:hypothetical protein
MDLRSRTFVARAVRTMRNSTRPYVSREERNRRMRAYIEQMHFLLDMIDEHGHNSL